MIKQSERLRSQAFQAERLSQTISDHTASRTLKPRAISFWGRRDGKVWSVIERWAHRKALTVPKLGLQNL